MPMIYDQDADVPPGGGADPRDRDAASAPTVPQQPAAADVPTPPLGQPAVPTPPPPPARAPEGRPGSPAWAPPGAPRSASPYVAPASPYGSPASPYGGSASPYGSPASPYGVPGADPRATDARLSPPTPPAGAGWDPRAPLPSQPPYVPVRGGVPPYGAPPLGPRPPYGAAVPPASPVPPRRRSSGWLVAAVVLAFLAAFAGAGVVATSLTQPTTRSSESGAGRITPSTPPTTVAPATPSPAPPSDPGTGGSGSGGSGGSSSAPTSWSDVAATVSAGVVNIQSLLPDGVGAGTGMVLTDSGEILTNNHVVDGAEAIEVTVVATGASYSAQIVGTDPRQDVALIKLEGASGLTTIPLGDSDQVQVGDEIAAIGNAGGRGGQPAVATGSVVGLNRQITASDQNGGDVQTLSNLIQVDAQVVPGDSGGPLATSEGKVVGMTTAASVGNGTGRSRYRTGANEGYAIPINRALSVIDQLRSGGGSGSSGNGSGRQGTANRGVLGVQVQSAGSGGAAVVGVQSNSGAQKAGLRAGDIIVEVDGTAVDTASDLTAALSGKQPGETVSVTWQTSSGRTRQADVTLG
ncbi:MAG: trypsin-like peptidase domain-containing protein [Acidimicrobiales bacterium]